jgi:hypothetical protein
MRRLLCTASLLLALSMSSFANTNETKLVLASENKSEAVVDKNSNDPCLITIKTVVATGEPGADSIDDGIVITITTTTVNICDPIGPIRR